MSLWEAEVRIHVEPAHNQPSIVVRDHFTEWLDALIEALGPEDPVRPRGTRPSRFSACNARLPGYNMTYLLREYALLRQVIVLVLEEQNAIMASDRLIIDGLMDECLALAADEFAFYQSFQLRVALKAAEWSNRDLEQSAAVAAHELKSPLTTIAGYLDLVEGVCGSRAAADRSAQPKASFVAVDLTEVADTATENLSNLITGARGIVDRECLPAMREDAVLLIQLFQVRIENGLKFNRSARPEVSINTRADKTNLIVEIRDNGIGFAAAQDERISERYARLHPNDFGGAGQGLTTARRIIDLHGGRIRASSEPGQGAPCTIHFPNLAHQ